jgi:hypothetical protein
MAATMDDGYYSDSDLAHSEMTNPDDVSRR